MSNESSSNSNATQDDSKDETFIPDRSFDSDDSRVGKSTSNKNNISPVVDLVPNQSTLLGLQNPDSGRNTLHLSIQRRHLKVPAEVCTGISEKTFSFDPTSQYYILSRQSSQSSSEKHNMNLITSLEAAFRILPKFEKKDGLHNFIKSAEFAFSCISEDLNSINLERLTILSMTL